MSVLISFIGRDIVTESDFVCTNEKNKTRHDKLVGLVDKMLVLTPKLRAAKNDSEQQTLQNAVSATDQQIDEVVYELYGLTEEEKNLVEGNK